MTAATTGPQKLKLGDEWGGHTYMGGDPSNQSSWVDVDGLVGSGLTGDAFLQTVQKAHPALVNTIKALSEGREAVPANRVMTDPYFKTAFQLAQQYDPTLDQASYPARQKTRTDFTTGTAAQNLRNLNQAIGHLHDLVQAVPGVAGHSGLLGLSHLMNMGQNFEADMSGDPDYTAYVTPQIALSGELASVFKGKGTSNEAEVQKLYNLLGTDSSTPQKYQAARSLASLLKSRADELGDQYNQGMGTTKNGLDLLNPTAAQQFQAIQQAGVTSAAPSALDPKTQALFQKYKVPGYSNASP